MNDWGRIGDRIYEILESIDARRATFKREARRRGASLNQLAAAAIAEMVKEEIEGSWATRTCGGAPGFFFERL
jgi:hypothetical protein